ncbi:hypothetical protein DRO97_02475 [Archaeoglobales archaeon]|nr:MAG: hypothetical protein DRO97_02475 [Archaeoglobales archaeon]
MQPYLPLLPFLIKYPFLKASGAFISKEYDLEKIINSEREFEREAKEEGKCIVLSVFDKCKSEFDEIKESFICLTCDEKPCKVYCKNKAINEKFDWNKCDLCLECFKNCSQRKSRYEENKNKAKKSIIAFLFSRILVSNLDEWVRRRYAIREARRYRDLMKDESDEFLLFLAKDLGIKAFINNDYFVHVTSYIKASSKIRAEEWRLVNRMLKKGYVVLDKDKFVRVLEEFLKERLLEKFEIDKDIKESIKPYIKEIESVVTKERTKFERIEFDKVDFNCFPPCMKKILADLRKSMNIPHTARFAITSFLLNIGLDVGQIINLFKSAPDFDEEKTRYQVEHIAGSKGTEYECPACDTMKTYQNCNEDESCKKINHPISYYRRYMRTGTKLK